MVVCDRCGEKLRKDLAYEIIFDREHPIDTCKYCSLIWMDMVKDLARKWETSFDSPTERKTDGKESGAQGTSEVVSEV